jgi:folate-binding protein YgfZ
MNVSLDPSRFAAPQAWPSGYDSLRRSLAWGDVGPRSSLAVRGLDAVRFIDGFTTAAVGRLEVGGGSEGFFTDARGQVICLAHLLRTEEGLVIDAPPGCGSALREHLEHYHIRERLEIVDESSARGHLVIAGPQATAWLTTVCGPTVPAASYDHRVVAIDGIEARLVRIDWFGTKGFLVSVAAEDRDGLEGLLAARGVPRGDAAAFEAARIEAGTPAAADIPDKTLPQELGRDAWAISFTKGCYLGQETVARIDALGHVNRRLVAVAFPAAATPAAGLEVRSQGDVVGRLTSACLSPALGCGLGLALVQAKALDGGRPLDVGGGRARIVTGPLEVAAGLPLPPPEAGAEVLCETRRFQVVRLEEPTAAGLRHREVIRHPGSVVIVPLVSAKEVCLIEVVRTAVGRTLLELPAGTLDRIEAVEEAARRELAEETGYRAGRMTAAGSVWMSPGILRERMHFFVAEDLEPGPQALEPGEQIQTRVVAWDEAVAMCLDGRIEDAKTIAGILLVDARRR